MVKSSINKEEFRRLVFQIVALIPKGRATSYVAIARAIGFPAHSRMVGSVLANSSDKNIPAHRVVNSQGQLSGRDAFGTSVTMEQLLYAEGVSVLNNRIQNWKIVFWDPMAELI